MPPVLSSPMTIKRIHREIADAKKEDLGAITLAPTPDNLFQWKGTIPGPQGSPYEGGMFNVDIQLASDYPFSAPKVTFATRIYHMNVSDKGGICIDILKQNWSPALSLFKVMLSLSSLLTDPNPHDPLGGTIENSISIICGTHFRLFIVPSIATEYLRSREQHDRTARRWTNLYARPPAPLPIPSTSTRTPEVASSNRTKGKEKASTSGQISTASNRLRSNGSTSKTCSQPETITIDDSEDEAAAARSEAPGTSRKRQRDDHVVDINLLEEGRTLSRRRTQSRSGRLIHTSGEVIVVDD
ncbi:ubiquitin-conjugating enzyme/RWD-like protein [Phlebopus sp. FC_14]|nr:ubiquitin-conjugating enzyme/RWD-like protein [Phlebopus sp. FC_14]